MENLLEIYNSQEYLLKNKKEGKIKTVIKAGNGIFEKCFSWLGYSIKKVDNQISCYPDLEECVKITNYNKYSKIPKQALIQVMSWYKQINDLTGNEAQVNFYYDKNIKTLKINNENLIIKNIKGVQYWNENIFSYTPIQINTSASTSTEDIIYNELNKQIGMFVETHSHNNMPAFASQTDLSNSLNNCIQLVFGNFNSDNIEMHSWATIRGLTKEYIEYPELNEYIELPEHTFNNKYYFNKNILNNINFTIWNNQIIEKERII